MNTLPDLIDRLWEDYLRLNPQALRIHKLLTARGDTLLNDHLAFRTFQHPKIGLDTLAAPFVSFGYTAKKTYLFPEKKLLAKHFEHQEGLSPKIFISELRVEEFSRDFQSIVTALIDQVPAELPKRWDFPVTGRPWSVSSTDYEALRKESEYSAWLAAFGFRANHFTLNVNALKSIDSLGELNRLMRKEGIKLNISGGEIKGTPDHFLEQSSTLATETRVTFSDGSHPVPGCYYEFAKRYPMADGKLFQGFVAQSADKIFESTDKKEP